MALADLLLGLIPSAKAQIGGPTEVANGVPLFLYRFVPVAAANLPDGKSWPGPLMTAFDLEGTAEKPIPSFLTLRPIPRRKCSSLIPSTNVLFRVLVICLMVR